MKSWIWVLWLIICAGLIAFFGRSLWFTEDKSQFLIGEATHGHHQIELACGSCHTDAFGGQEVLQDACVNCHGAELAESQDSHPRKKFTNPRDAQRIEGLDARYCVSCHTEHQQEQTHAMGLTLPKDYCYHCHSDVGEERESHAGYGFETCASAGCHNYHDNRALYENFLVANANQPWLSDIAALPTRAHAANFAHDFRPVTANTATATAMTNHPDLTESWTHTVHGKAEVECSHCHTDANANWLDAPGPEQCASCHAEETEGFLASKHGMRLATESLAPMTPAHSQLDFQASANNKHQSCNACHSAHEFNTQTAAVESCLTCHADEHSLAFIASPHGQLWADTAIAPEQKVSCASCHLPRIDSGKKDDQGNPVMRVEHNQNATLRPNEKMIRPVCMSCHSLEFSINALADEQLINNNFNGQPTQHVPSIDWALKRASQ